MFICLVTVNFIYQIYSFLRKETFLKFTWFESNLQYLPFGWQVFTHYFCSDLELFTRCLKQIGIQIS